MFGPAVARPTVSVRPERRSDAESPQSSPRVVQYVYVHDEGEAFRYPSSRDRSGDPARLAVRYLECALVQAASLRMGDADCDLALVTNVTDRRRLGRAGARLVEEIEALGVELVHAPYEHAPRWPAPLPAYNYVFDAILAASAGEDPGRTLWLADVDCVWVSCERAFAATPSAPAVGYVEIPYPPDWGFGPNRQSIGRLAQRLGAPPGPPPPWVGGELLTGRSADLVELVRVCESLDGELAAREVELEDEEHLLTLAFALGRIEMENIGGIADRIWTGPRHGALPPEDPRTLAIWHLPSEKGLAFRRAAREIAGGRPDRLARDLGDPARAMRRFNIAGSSRARRARDDLWLLKQRGLDAARAGARGRPGRRSAA